MTSQRQRIAAIVSRLLEWFPRNARDLPWRRTTDPYGIWVSEIMLQQTQVKTVLPYWERWMRMLPTVEALAHERAERLHKLWEGLGYYRRVRNMHRAARVIMQQHGGKFPRDFEQILALPGVGPYTAGAISSIAFSQPKPVLDGNVIRVLCRCLGISGNPRAGQTNKELWRLAGELVSEAARSAVRVARPFSQLNQALMELGALVCLPRQPRCADCPLVRICVARRQDRVEELPNLGRKAVATSRHFLAFVVERNGRYLVRQRPAEAVNGLLWEFPNVETAKDETNMRRAARQALGFALTFRDPVGRGSQRTSNSKPAKPSGTDGFRGSVWSAGACSRFGSAGPFESAGKPAHSKRSAQFEAAGTIMDGENGEPTPLCIIKHSITRYRITVQAFRVEVSGAEPPLQAEGKWLSLQQLEALPFASAHRKILVVLKSGR